MRQHCRVPSPDHSVLADRLECLYNLVYLAEKPLSAHPLADQAEALHHLRSIRTHLDAMKLILRRMALESANGEAA